MRAKRLEFAISLDRRGELTAENERALALPTGWTPEHLLLAGLARCMIASLLHHTRKRKVDATADAFARGVVTKREDDGRYAFVEIECRVEVEIDPLPADAVDEILGLAERGCFIAASLTVTPHYEWHVNGERVTRS